ncbi:hypothetical protein KKC59_02020 [bacterium]|nr:hypothetical protein [bacterium]
MLRRVFFIALVMSLFSIPGVYSNNCVLAPSTILTANAVQIKMLEQKMKELIEGLKISKGGCIKNGEYSLGYSANKPDRYFFKHNSIILRLEPNGNMEYENTTTKQKGFLKYLSLNVFDVVSKEINGACNVPLSLKDKVLKAKRVVINGHGSKTSQNFDMPEGFYLLSPGNLNTTYVSLVNHHMEPLVDKGQVPLGENVDWTLYKAGNKINEVNVGSWSDQELNKFFNQDEDYRASSGYFFLANGKIIEKEADKMPEFNIVKDAVFFYCPNRIVKGIVYKNVGCIKLFKTAQRSVSSILNQFKQKFPNEDFLFFLITCNAKGSGDKYISLDTEKKGKLDEVIGSQSFILAPGSEMVNVGDIKQKTAIERFNNIKQGLSDEIGLFKKQVQGFNLQIEAVKQKPLEKNFIEKISDGSLTGHINIDIGMLNYFSDDSIKFFIRNGLEQIKLKLLTKRYGSLCFDNGSQITSGVEALYDGVTGLEDLAKQLENQKGRYELEIDSMLIVLKRMSKEEIQSLIADFDINNNYYKCIEEKFIDVSDAKKQYLLNSVKKMFALFNVTLTDEFRKVLVAENSSKTVIEQFEEQDKNLNFRDIFSPSLVALSTAA